MKSKEAIRIAKKYIADVFADENIARIGLEELKYDEGRWKVTIGFNRTWPSEHPSSLMHTLADPMRGRIYKMVEIRDDGEVTAMIHRKFSNE